MSTPDSGRGPGRPRKISVDRQRELVLHAATRAFVHTGAETATIEEIARLAGLTRQSVYELYGERGALFDAAVNRARERAIDALSGGVLHPPEADLATVARRDYARIFEFVSNEPAEYELLRLAERRGNEVLTELHAQLAPLYASASRRRWEAAGVESGRADEALVALYFAMAEEVVRMSRSADEQRSAALLDLLTEFTVGGVTRILRHTPGVIDRLR